MADDELTLDDALYVLRTTDGSEGQTFVVLMAGYEVMRQCEDWRVTFDDLLHCLDFGGIVAEYGVRGLYVRTGRDGIGWGSFDDSTCVDRSEWESYLRTQDLWDSTP